MCYVKAFALKAVGVVVEKVINAWHICVLTDNLEKYQKKERNSITSTRLMSSISICTYSG